MRVTGVGGVGLAGGDGDGVAAVQGDGDVAVDRFTEADREGLLFGFAELGLVGHDADADRVAAIGITRIAWVTRGAGFVGDGDAGLTGGDELFELTVAVVLYRGDAVDQGGLAAFEGVVGGGHGGAAAEFSGGDGDRGTVGEAELEAVVSAEVGALRAGQRHGVGDGAAFGDAVTVGTQGGGDGVAVVNRDDGGFGTAIQGLELTTSSACDSKSLAFLALLVDIIRAAVEGHTASCFTRGNSDLLPIIQCNNQRTALRGAANAG